jgi:hypothetical protein
LVTLWTQLERPLDSEKRAGGYVEQEPFAGSNLEPYSAPEEHPMNQEEFDQKLLLLESKVKSLEDWRAERKASALRTDEEKKLIFAAYAKGVDTQMHFNEMVMKVRNFAITFIIAVFGAAAYSMQTPVHVAFLSRDVHISALIVLFGLLGWFSLYILDPWYYHRLLRGAVEFGNDMHTKYSPEGVLGDVLGMTRRITTISRTKGIKAAWKVHLFYLVIFGFGIILFVLLWRGNIAVPRGNPNQAERIEVQTTQPIRVVIEDDGRSKIGEPQTRDVEPNK